MKSFIAFSISFLFISYFAQAQDVAEKSSEDIKETRQSKDLPARTVKIELEEVENSSGYDVEVISLDRKWHKPHRFKIKGNILRLRLSPGRYKVHTRSYNEQGEFGNWSAWQNFVVHYKAPKNIYPKDKMQLQAISKNKEKITFEWPEIKGTYAYLFELRDEKNKLITKRVLINYFNVVELPIGQTYKWTIVPLSYEGEEKDKGLKKNFNTFSIIEPVPNTTPVAIEIEKKPGAYKYEFEFVKFISYNETAEPSRFESILPEFRASLNPGEYEMRVRALYRDKTKSDWSAPERFYVPYTSAAPIYPAEKKVIDPNHPHKAEIDFRWKRVADAKRYIVYLMDENSNVVDKVETEKTYANLYAPADNTYHYHIQAYSYREKVRPPPKVGDRTTKIQLSPYISHQFSKTEEPSNIYGWASWIASQIDYESLNFDNNSKTINSILGSTAELAAGYWHRTTKFGLLVFADLSGFSIDGENFFYNTYGGQLGYRWIPSELDRARVWVGWAEKQMPELITRPGTDFLDVQNVITRGLYLQGSYLKSINQEYGWFSTAKLYQSIGDEGTPNGLALGTMQSIQLGAFITKALGKKYRGRLGYTFRQERVDYNTNSVKYNSSNEVTITGHYLSFILEFAINEPQDFMVHTP